MTYLIEFFVNGKVADTLFADSNTPQALTKAQHIFLIDRGWNDKLSGDDKIRVACADEDKRVTDKRRSNSTYTME